MSKDQSFTKLPNEAIPKLKELTREEIIFWMYLKSRCFQKGHCWPSYKTIMEDLGFRYRSHVHRRLKSLEKKGWLRIETTDGRSNRYYPIYPNQSQEHATSTSNQNARQFPVVQSRDNTSRENTRHEQEKRRRQNEEENIPSGVELARIYLNGVTWDPLREKSKAAFVSRVSNWVKDLLPRNADYETHKATLENELTRITGDPDFFRTSEVTRDNLFPFWELFELQKQAKLEEELKKAG